MATVEATLTQGFVFGDAATGDGYGVRTDAASDGLVFGEDFTSATYELWDGCMFSLSDVTSGDSSGSEHDSVSDGLVVGDTPTGSYGGNYVGLLNQGVVFGEDFTTVTYEKFLSDGDEFQFGDSVTSEGPTSEGSTASDGLVFDESFDLTTTTYFDDEKLTFGDSIFGAPDGPAVGSPSDGLVIRDNVAEEATGPATITEGLVLGDSVRGPMIRAPGDTIYTAELVAYDPNTAGEVTLYYATGMGFVTEQDDTPAETHFDARITQPLDVGRTLFALGSTYGRTQIGFGELVLLNPDGGLDDLITYGLDGRTLTIRRGRVGAAYPSAWTTVFSGTMEQPEVSETHVTVRVRDGQFGLARPVQDNFFAGTNDLPDGLEGTSDDIMGQPKPLCFGKVENIAPPCVNTAKLIYQVHDGAVQDITAVYDRGIALTESTFTPFASEAALLSGSVGAGYWRAWRAGGMLKVGSVPDGELTCDVEQGATAADRTPAQLFRALLERSGMTTGDWSAADITALDAAAGYEVGVWVNEEATYVNVIHGLLESVGAWWAPDRDGVVRVRQLVAPSAPAILSLTAADLLAPIVRLVSRDKGYGLPPYRQTVLYRKNYTVQRDTVTSAAQQSYRSNKWRQATAVNAWTLVRHPLAPSVAEESCLVDIHDANMEAARRLAMRSANIDRFELVAPMNDETMALELGDVIQLTHSRYNLDAGVLFRVMGIRPEAAHARLVLDVWGASPRPDPLNAFGADEMLVLVMTPDKTTEGRTVRIPLQGTMNVTIDWGDGSTSTHTTANPEHVYAVHGAYLIRITGTCERLGNDTSHTRWTRAAHGVLQWGSLGLTSLRSAFQDLPVWTLYLPADLPATVTSLRYMFQNCRSLGTVDVSGWNTSNVEDMQFMFYGCRSLRTVDVSGFNTSSVTGMGFFNMFALCSSLTTLDVSGFNTSLATTLGNMFRLCSSLTTLDVSGFNTSSVGNMLYVFSGCAGLSSLNVTGWDTSLVAGMTGTFENMGSVDVDVSGWVIASMSSAESMFEGSTLPTARYDALLIGWEGQASIPSGRTFHGGDSTYTAGGAAAAARASLVSTHLWAITDGGTA